MIPCPKSDAELDELLSQPYQETVEMMKRLDGDILILGIAGKMGPTLGKMALKACEAAGVTKRVIGVARFSEPGQQELLQAWGIETIKADLSDLEQVRALPQAKNVIFMAGRKFGSVGSEALTWVMNVTVPGLVAQEFRDSRIVAFSTGCIYALLPPEAEGSTEADEPAPVGEYANSCLGRERMFEYYSTKFGTPVTQYRLNYAIDLRYGVLVDIAQAIWDGRPVNRGVQAVNVIWQGDANNRALLSLELASSPPYLLNITGPEKLSIETLALKLGEELGKQVTFEGESQASGYLSDASRSMELFGPPRVPVDWMVKCTADWIKHGGRNLGKPTHFQVTDGQFLDAPASLEVK